jgi:molybdopterin synthase sulfur carrier subunit
MKVLIPGPLRSYTDERSWVEASGATLGEVLDDLDRRFPGIRFRMIDEQEQMRRHIRFFVNAGQTFDLAQPLQPADELCIVQALSGG